MGTTDFAPYLAEIKRANPDLVYASYAGSDAVRFVQQFASFGLDSSIKLAGYGYLAEEDTFAAQGDAAVGIYSSLNWAYGIDTPVNKAFVSTYRKTLDAIPTVDSVAGYVGAQVVWDAFNRLGGKVPSQEALSKAIEETKIDTPRGPISFDPDTHNVIQNIYIREAVKEGSEIHNKVLANVRRGSRSRRVVQLHDAPLARCGRGHSLWCRSWSEFIAIQTLNSLVYSMLLFLLALGLSLTFGLLRVVNLAHGGFYLLGAYVGLSVWTFSHSFWSQSSLPRWRQD